jgi:hypothetical protein
MNINPKLLYLNEVSFMSKAYREGEGVCNAKEGVKCDKNAIFPGLPPHYS